MNITLYKSSAERIKVDKTSQIEEIGNIVGNLRDATSIPTPTIVVNAESLVNAIVDDDGMVVETSDSTELVTGENLLLETNYIYIEEFKRWYFVDSITAVTNKLFALSCSVDVLMSFKDGILNLTAFIDRQENDNNPYLVDSELHLSDQPSVTTTEITTQLLDETINQSTPCVVFNVITKN